MLFIKLAEYLRSSPQATEFQIALVGEASEDAYQVVTEATVLAEESQIVEGEFFSVQEVGAPEDSGLTHFLDGAQATRRVGFHNYTVPLVYGHIGAVIRERKSDRRMATFLKDTADSLYFSFAHVPPGSLGIRDVDLQDASPKAGGPDDSGELHPLRLADIARRAVSNRRALLERELAEQWVKRCGPSDWLLWDGSITGSKVVSQHSRTIGIIKSHNTQYFREETQRRILALKPGERSCVFKPRGGDWTPVYSWYLRLRPFDGLDVYHGLVRVEVAAAEESLGLVDRISRWLLHERTPLSLPDPRWDRMIYPIRDCEQYLRSIGPSNVAIESGIAACLSALHRRGA